MRLYLLILTLFIFQDSFGQCTNSTANPGQWVYVDINALEVEISNCNYTTEFSGFKGIKGGYTYSFSCSLGATEKYATITTASNVLLAHGPTPLSWTAPNSDDIFVHWTDDSSCNFTAACHVTTVTCTSCPGPPSNDDCAGAILITDGESGSITGSFPGATKSSVGNQVCDGYILENPDMWYKLNTDNDDLDGEQLTVTVVPSADMDIAIYVYSGDCSGLTLEGCSDLGVQGGTEEVSITVTNGLTTKGGSASRNDIDYYVTVKQWGPLSTGTFTISAAGSALLPIDLISFAGEAMRDHNKITWTTQQEINNDYQIIEKSYGGASGWMELGRVNATNTDRPTDYEMIDDSPGVLTYYRLKAVDLDGFTEYFDVVSVDRKDKVQSGISIYPNPTSEYINMKISLTQDSPVNYSLVDITGKVVARGTSEMQTGINTQPIDMTLLNSGVYILMVNTPLQSYSQKVIKE